MRCSIIVERKMLEINYLLIMRDRKDALEERLQKIELNLSADITLAMAQLLKLFLHAH